MRVIQNSRLQTKDGDKIGTATGCVTSDAEAVWTTETAIACVWSTPLDYYIGPYTADVQDRRSRHIACDTIDGAPRRSQPETSGLVRSCPGNRQTDRPVGPPVERADRRRSKTISGIPLMNLTAQLARCSVAAGPK